MSIKEPKKYFKKTKREWSESILYWFIFIWNTADILFLTSRHAAEIRI